jgi:putative Ca2+/H+ antiporter (TMEM165/GDT1 family)
MEAFWASLGLVFLAELGDKTQLVALSLAARFRTGVVLAGILTATLAVHIVSVVLGGCAEKCLPRNWIGFLAGMAFIVFGFWTLRGDCVDEESCKVKRCPNPFWLVTVTFFLAELGDKTMLTTIAAATKYPLALKAVWLGSSLGMVISDGLAIWVGKMLGARLPERAIKIGASVIFFSFGLVSAAQGGRTLHPAFWAVGAVSLAVVGYVFLRPRSVAIPLELQEREELAEPVLR